MWEIMNGYRSSQQYEMCEYMIWLNMKYPSHTEVAKYEAKLILSQERWEQFRNLPFAYSVNIWARITIICRLLHLILLL